MIAILAISCTKQNLYNITNAFSPNNDGINDTFILPFASSSLTIFDRNNDVIYKSDNYTNNWTAENVKDGTYFYSIAYNGNTINGYVSIFR